MSFDFLLARCSFVEWCFKFLSQIWIVSSVFRPWCILSFDLSMLLQSATHSLLFHAGINLFLHLFFLQLNGCLDFSYSLLSLIFFKFEQSLFFNSLEMLFLNFFNFLLIVFMQVFYFLYILSNRYFLTINSIHVCFVEISFFSKFFPCRFGIISNNVCLFQLNFHSFNFLL